MILYEPGAISHQSGGSASTGYATAGINVITWALQSHLHQIHVRLKRICIWPVHKINTSFEKLYCSTNKLFIVGLLISQFIKEPPFKINLSVKPISSDCEILHPWPYELHIYPTNIKIYVLKEIINIYKIKNIICRYVICWN